MAIRVNRKPDWFKINLNVTSEFRDVRGSVENKRLHTVCEEARCPNLHECWGRGTATFMILGDVCTRSCRFCAVKTGRPEAPDWGEPLRLAETIRDLKLKHIVITSVNRDELKDGGAGIWAETIRKIKELNPGTSVEVLTPDFKGIWEQLKTVLDAGPDIYSHNLETVPSLYPKIRPQAKYHRSLDVLRMAADDGAITKTGIMLGLGEERDEVIALMGDALAAGVEILNMGQYLQPTKQHAPVARFVPPQEFAEYREIGMEMGFKWVEAGPLVRSSYHAEEQLKQLRAQRRAFKASG